MKKETKSIILVVGVTLLFTFGGVWLVSGMLQKNSPSTPSVVVGEDLSILVREDSHKIESETAKVTLVEFSDFECPACGASAPAVKSLLEKYPGQITLVFRHFPLSFHKHAKSAALATEAAGKQDMFWQMHDVIFERQAEWSELASAEDTFKEYALEMGLDADQYSQDIADPALAEKIQRDVVDGNKLGVDATPSYFINGRKVLGVNSIEFFQVLRDELGVEDSATEATDAAN